MYRYAQEKDIPTILFFIKELAKYEKMLYEVSADEVLLKKWLFEKKTAKVIFAMENEKEVGFALFFYNFSTFLGKAGIYLEDLFILPEYRHKGYGIGLIKELARYAKENDCGRLEWCCLNWNKPSIDFYLSLGAKPMDDWTTYRLTSKEIDALLK